jgi:hypothetical protein
VSNADGRVNNNAAGTPVSNFVDYNNFLTSPPAIPVGPFVVSHTPTLSKGSSGGVSSIDFVFSDVLDLSTFTPADLTVTGPQTPVNPIISYVGGTTYRLSFGSPLTVEGNYLINVGPDVRTAAGYRMDQDLDGNAGESLQDRYTAALRIDKTGPRLTSSTPSGGVTIAGAVDHIDVTFSEAIKPATFTPADVVVNVPGGGTTHTLSVTQLSATQFRVGFAVQTVNGDYSLVIGPNVADLAGNPMNQDNDGTSGEVPGDQATVPFKIQRAALRIVAQTPTGNLGAGVDHVDVTFSAPALAASFTPSDVTLLGPQGFVAITGVERLTDTQYRIRFASLSAEGTYTLKVGPDITDPANDRMDQDNDGSLGEAIDDVYAGGFTIDGVGPRVTASSPTGTGTGTLSEVTVTFNEAINTGTFTTSDVTIEGPNGTITPSTIQSLGSNQFKITFPAQTAFGAYTFRVGPNVTDTTGNLMDQDADGVKGEATQDRFSFAVTIAPTQVTGTDLAVDQVAFSGTPTIGQHISVAWRVTNLGGTTTSVTSWSDRVFLSADSTLAPANDVLLGTFVHSGALTAGGT